jgi:hypothetical protein
VESRIDLDAAAREIARRIDRWRASGMTIDDVTWRDQADGWPPPFKTDRNEVRDPDSIGIRCSKGEQEGSLVLFKGGWCDLDFWSGSAAIVEAPGHDDSLTVDSYGRLLDRFFALFD